MIGNNKSVTCPCDLIIPTYTLYFLIICEPLELHLPRLQEIKRHGIGRSPIAIEHLMFSCHCVSWQVWIIWCDQNGEIGKWRGWCIGRGVIRKITPEVFWWSGMRKCGRCWYSQWSRWSQKSWCRYCTRWVSELSLPWSQAEFSKLSREAFERVTCWLDRGIRDGRNGGLLFAVSIGVKSRRILKVQFFQKRTVRWLETWVGIHCHHHME